MFEQCSECFKCCKTAKSKDRIILMTLDDILEIAKKTKLLRTDFSEQPDMFRRAGMLIYTMKSDELGACYFLKKPADKNNCLIHDVKPLVCKSYPAPITNLFNEHTPEGIKKEVIEKADCNLDLYFFPNKPKFTLEERTTCYENYKKFVNRISSIIETHEDGMRKLEQINKSKYIILKYLREISKIINSGNPRSSISAGDTYQSQS